MPEKKERPGVNAAKTPKAPARDFGDLPDTHLITSGFWLDLHREVKRLTADFPKSTVTLLNQ
jgi:hypothetical protein